MTETYWTGSPFEDWSPSQLAYALRYRLALVERPAGREAILIGPTGRRHATGHKRAWMALSRLATRQGIDPKAPPRLTPSALRNGCEPDFIAGYFEAMAFTDFGPDDEDLKDATTDDLAPELYWSSIDDCLRFQDVAADLLTVAYERDYEEAQAGRDLWLTRNGHGAGYWDRKPLSVPMAESYPETLGERLSELCGHGTDFRQVELYRGDDGKVYA